LGIALNKLAEEDPTFQVKTDEHTDHNLIGRIGDLHLELIHERSNTLVPISRH
jgi:elongation factor G